MQCQSHLKLPLLPQNKIMPLSEKVIGNKKKEREGIKKAATLDD